MGMDHMSQSGDYVPPDVLEVEIHNELTDYQLVDLEQLTTVPTRYRLVGEGLLRAVVDFARSYSSRVVVETPTFSRPQGAGLTVTLTYNDGQTVWKVSFLDSQGVPCSVNADLYTTVVAVASQLRSTVERPSTAGIRQFMGIMRSGLVNRFRSLEGALLPIPRPSE
jgi:hypothetical protein